MKSKSTLNHLFLIAVPILMFGVLGCDTDDVGDDVGVGDSYVPRVRLVKDGPNEFHFQWDEPLKEERIILLYFDHIVVITTNSNPNYRGSGEIITGFRASESPYQRLVFFPEGAFISAPIKSYAPFVEILAARERDEFPLPAKVFNRSNFIPPKSATVEQRILKEHPFKPYQVGKPPRITLEPPELPEPRTKY